LLAGAACFQLKSIVCFLIEQGADVNGLGAMGTPPLCSAARNGHTDIAKILIEKGAHTECCSLGLTPLFLASRNGHTETFRFLLRKALILMRMKRQ